MPAKDDAVPLSEDQIVYLVTDGEWSDYGVDSAFLDEAPANDRVDEINKTPWGYARVEKYQVGKVGRLDNAS